MTDISPSSIRLLEKAIDSKRSKTSRKKESSQPAIVTRVDEDGMPWVHIPGGSEETPVRFNTSVVSKGDVVDVTIQNGYAKITGNITNPSTDDRVAIAARMVAIVADRTATEALGSAESAAAAAEVAHIAADSAKQSADVAASAANTALINLSTVEDVIGVLDWVTEHGQYIPTEDESVSSGKVYYVRTGSGTQADPYIYTAVSDPVDDDIETYYELEINQALSQFVASHLALTDAGLYVLKDASSWRTLTKSNGWELQDSYGNAVISLSPQGINYNASYPQYIGSEDAYILFTPASGSTPASITIGGSNIHLGDSRSLSELLAQVDGTIVFKVTESYSQDGSTATLTAHVYKGGEDVASTYPDSCFAWFRKSEESETPLVPLPSPYTNGRVVQVERSTAGFGSTIVCHFSPPNDSGLLTEDDDVLTDSDDNALTGRTPSGEYVRVSDLSIETTVFDTDKVMVVSSEGEHLVAMSTLKETFGDGDYERLDNKPSIESVTLSGDKTFEDLGLTRLTNTEIENALT